MDDDVRLLDDRIESDMRALNDLEYGTPERKALVEEINTLTKLRLERVKNESDREFQISNCQNNIEIQRQNRKADLIGKIGTALIGFVGLCIGYGLKQKNLRDTFRFEETGSITSTAGKNSVRDALDK